jgi:hypothetical protein
MIPCHNLPSEQRFTQRLVDQFNSDERLWAKLEPRRQARRQLLSDVLSEDELRELDLREFGREKPPQDCIGQPVLP